jgi:predicted metallopeptidase
MSGYQFWLDSRGVWLPRTTGRGRENSAAHRVFTSIQEISHIRALVSGGKQCHGAGGGEQRSANAFRGMKK